MNFQNYSQTYASAITTLAGFILLILNQLGVHFLDNQGLEFIIGAAVNVFGIFWTIYHRHSQGDVTLSGFKKKY